MNNFCNLYEIQFLRVGSMGDIMSRLMLCFLCNLGFVASLSCFLVESYK